MVHFYSSTHGSTSITIYAGKDKHENEDLIKHAWPEDVWVHVDKLSSPHIYLRLPDGTTIDSIPPLVLADAAQLVKAGSIHGNKVDNVAVIYTYASNLLKTGDMDIGSVSFKQDRAVKRVHVKTRDNAIVNRLKKTMQVRTVDFEAERIERQRVIDRAKRQAFAESKAAELEMARQRAADQQERSYDWRSDAAIAAAQNNNDDDDFW